MTNFIKKQQSAAWLAIGCLLLLLVLVIYWPGLRGGFFFDDSVNILEQESVQLKAISWESLLYVWDSGIAGPLGRPVSMLSFAANYYFSDFDPYWFKLTNLLIHCVNGILVYLLGLLTLRAAAPSINSLLRARLVGLVVAAMWALNPIQLTSVLYVVQRMTSLSAMFLLLSMTMHVWARQKKSGGWKNLVCYALAWGVFFPLAVFSKETGVLYLLYVAVYEALIQRRLKSGLDHFAKIYLILLGLAGAGLLGYLGLAPGGGLLGGYQERSFNLVQRLLTECRIIWVYIEMILAPTMPAFGLYHDDFVISTELFKPPATFAAICTLGLLFLSACLLWKRAVLVSFGIFWFLAGHSLESSIFPLELMHEHRNYLPSFGILLAVGSALTSRKMTEPIYKMLTSGAILVLFLYSALITHLRADMYGDDFRRTQIESSYRSESLRSNYEAGALLVNMYNQHREPLLMGFAEKYFERVNSLDPTYKLGLIGMLQLDCLSDKSARVEAFDELTLRLANGKWIPFDRTVMHGIAEMANEGTLCLSREQVDQLFTAALANKSASLQDRSVVKSDYTLYLWLGQKDYVAARDVLTSAVIANENDVLNRINLLQLRRRQGDAKGVLASLADLRGKNLSRQDRALLQEVSSELVAQGVIANNL